MGKKKRKEKRRVGKGPTADGVDGKITFVPARIPDTNVIPYLYRKTCNGLITGTNEGYGLV
jgi:hypothetical protein